MSITLSELDVRRFREMLVTERMSRRKREYASRLANEIEQARILPPEQIPADIVTMRSLVRVRDTTTGTTQTFHLVYPDEADPDLLKISILDPLGLAVIGEKVGATVAWESPQGTKSIVIEKIHYQPESLKKYYL